MLCLVQFVNGGPQRHVVAGNLRELRVAVSGAYAYRDVEAVLARLAEQPGEGRYDLGDGYWLLVGERRSRIKSLITWLASAVGGRQ